MTEQKVAETELQAPMHDEFAFDVESVEQHVSVEAIERNLTNESFPQHSPPDLTEFVHLHNLFYHECVH